MDVLARTSIHSKEGKGTKAGFRRYDGKEETVFLLFMESIAKPVYFVNPVKIEFQLNQMIAPGFRRDDEFLRSHQK